MLDNKVLIENIRRLCDTHNIKITNLEKELGFGAGIINRWGNDADPSLSKIMQVAEYFHVSIDDIIGYKYIIHNEFLEKLIFQTSNKIIQWKNYSNENDKEPKQYFGFDMNSYEFIDQSDIDYFFETHKELSYYYDFNGVYVSIYAYYDHHNIISPNEIKLFIQPAFEAELIEQDYSYEQLKTLWLKVLYSMEMNAPDEIKAEEFKNEFISNHSLTNGTNQIVNKEGLSDIEKIIDDPAIMKLMEIYNQPVFQELQKTFSSPEMQTVIQTANKLQKYFDKLRK